MAKFAEVIQCLRHGGTAARQAWDVLGNKEVMMQIPQRIAKDVVPIFGFTLSCTEVIFGTMSLAMR